MKKKILGISILSTMFFALSSLSSFNLVKAVNVNNLVAAPQNLMVPNLAYSSSSITLVWDKPTVYSNVKEYDIYENGKLVGNTTNLNYTVQNLTPSTAYSFTVRAKDGNNVESDDSNAISETTTPTAAVFDVTKYGAVGDGKTIDTKSIQAAIDACTSGGVVVIPSGTFVSGAIYLKSNMSLEVDGTLLGSDNPSDYAYSSMRFPYYYQPNYMGLINAYTTNYGSLTNIKVYGKGTVSGGTYTSGNLTALGSAETKLKGDKGRGDLITVKGVTNFYLSGLTLINPAEHTIFISYSKNITVDGISAKTYGIHNADGIDVATSDTTKIFNSYFDNGDDCINFNAGYGEDAVKENIPCSNIRVFDDNTYRGHGGVVFGSYTGAWIKNVMVEDCNFNGTNIGLRFKTSKYIGGGATNVTARDITMSNIVNDAISLDSNYSLTPVSNPAVPGVFQNVTIQNVTCQTAGGYGIWINALPTAYNSGINLTNVTLTSCKKGASISYLKDSTFTGVSLVNCGKAPWNVSNTSNVNFVSCTPTFSTSK
ncbi:glycosyl hydrolase family 28 protein [Clostridium hydrogenum]|uniref:glycosyl hydrolase family 28 protein n=1 Tax=Clostridium hydrogenum TaxID=2855764 RepID=UPI001F32C565|nr:glycoside hydrolase family 28 protein [Clostridium hydrogenum]